MAVCRRNSSGCTSCGGGAFFAFFDGAAFLLPGFPVVALMGAALDEAVDFAATGGAAVLVVVLLDLGAGWADDFVEAAVAVTPAVVVAVAVVAALGACFAVLDAVVSTFGGALALPASVAAAAAAIDLAAATFFVPLAALFGVEPSSGDKMSGKCGSLESCLAIPFFCLPFDLDGGALFEAADFVSSTAIALGAGVRSIRLDDTIVVEGIFSSAAVSAMVWGAGVRSIRLDDKGVVARSMVVRTGVVVVAVVDDMGVALLLRTRSDDMRTKRPLLGGAAK